MNLASGSLKFHVDGMGPCGGSGRFPRSTYRRAMRVRSDNKGDISRKGFAYNGEIIPETRLNAGIQGGGGDTRASSCHDILPEPYAVVKVMTPVTCATVYVNTVKAATVKVTVSAFSQATASPDTTMVATPFT